MTITNETTIETLIALGIIKSTIVGEWNSKAVRLQVKAEKARLVTGTKDAIMAIMSSDFEKETLFFSVKKTSNSTGLLGFIDTDRATVLKALSQLVKSGLITKVGVIGGEVMIASDVNAFQIRYMRA